MKIALIIGFIVVNSAAAWLYATMYSRHVKRSEKTYMGIGLLQERFRKEFKIVKKELYYTELFVLLASLIFLVALCLHFYL